MRYQNLQDAGAIVGRPGRWLTGFCLGRRLEEPPSSWGAGTASVRLKRTSKKGEMRSQNMIKRLNEDLVRLTLEAWRRKRSSCLFEGGHDDHFMLAHRMPYAKLLARLYYDALHCGLTVDPLMLVQLILCQSRPISRRSTPQQCVQPEL